ncbi:MAG: hypothetical protein ACYTFI_04380 [Planctomycetota bacterium]
MSRILALAACAACVLAGCKPKEPGAGTGSATREWTAPEGQKVNLPVGEAKHLNGDDRQWNTVSVPVVATSDSGRVYVLGAEDYEETLLVPSGFPVIPPDMILVTEVATVPSLTVFDGGTWQMAQLLARFPHQCLPRFAWCSGEDLNLLAEMADSRWHHLRYSPATREWEDAGTVEASHNAGAYDIVVGPEAGTVHVAAAGDGEIRYFRYDGEGWSDALRWKSQGQLLNPKLAVTGDGKNAPAAIHVVWTTWGSGTNHVAMAGGEPVMRELDLGERPIAETEPDPFEIGVSPEGKPFLAYKAALGEGHEDRDRIHLSTWDGEAWSAGAPVFTVQGALLGMIKLARSGRKTFLMWQHRMDYTVGEESRSHPVWSYAVQDAEGKWSDPAPLLRLPDDAGYLGENALCLHVDQWRLAHVAWYDDVAQAYHAIVTDLAE